MIKAVDREGDQLLGTNGRDSGALVSPPPLCDHRPTLLCNTSFSYTMCPSERIHFHLHR